MPNWCYNEIKVQGSKEALLEIGQLLVEAKRDGDKLLEKILPIPDHIFRGNVGSDRIGVLDENGEPTEWYTWCCEYWGTKWDVDGLEFDITETEIGISFLTAWTPPREAMCILSEKLNCTITHNFFEWGDNFVGSIKFVNGEVVVDEWVNCSKEALIKYGFDGEVFYDRSDDGEST
ncbi:MAG: hypothetical protein KF802_02590 [Bdellovibrionaceae bacterium]|nr:hypothetical protein [Pseudobdellovibrionaceae bacterium]